jgi:oxalate decarboxylase/phosphoglucose isomerase-like protein (cupin superfamily)
MHEVSADDRRTIQELVIGDATVQRFEITGATKPLGNHYHREKTETFTILSGGGTVYLVEVDDQSGEAVEVSDVMEVIATEGCVIVIPPYHAHRLDLTKGTIMHAYSDRPFDPADMPDHEVTPDAELT